ncbi:hypothetical protein OIE43_18750 [Streptomyces pseudovenezuelae]|uniref:hypothetical protein n=1 Tax=Streptomyces pseudovenezuelae TaxID=67350 RepID=UPI002E3156C4|nr:hypothetical protein [Streptomyces pseudovenezuelae]
MEPTSDVNAPPPNESPALRLVETGPEAGPEVLVHTTAHRLMACSHWLLCTLDAHKRDRARMEWQELGVALLPLGVLFAAVRIPERVVHAAARIDHPQAVDQYLAAALDDGPVIHDLDRHRYYALVPASMPTRWNEAAPVWRNNGIECFGRDTLLGVPPVDAVSLDTRTNQTYWSVPMPSPGVLCDPQDVARMIAAAGRCSSTIPDHDL